MLGSDLRVFVSLFRGGISTELPTVVGYLLPFGRLELPQWAEGSSCRSHSPSPRNSSRGTSQVELNGTFFYAVLAQIDSPSLSMW